jgi:hypothetical protein
MSRLTADQESRGGDGDSGAGEEDSVMRVNLAEGCGAVNDQTCRWLTKSLFSRADPGALLHPPALSLSRQTQGPGSRIVPCLSSSSFLFVWFVLFIWFV